METAHASVQAQKLVVVKGKKPILDGLTFAVKPGTVTGLIGPSGSGKTTLMRAMVGVQQYDGMLTVLGKKAGAKKLRSKIGYVTQSPAIYTDLTVKQNLQYFAVLENMKKTAIGEVLKRVDLQAQKDQHVETLSGGQKARVSLAIALLSGADLLVFDEPTVGLDPILRLHLWKLFHELADEGKTLVISSHVMDEADQCEELLLLRDGKLLWNNSREALLDHTKTENVGAAFLQIVEGE